MKSRHGTSKGFTLVELMIVIAIIGILAGIALPIMGKYVAKSQIVRVYTELSHYRNPINQLLTNGDVTGLATNAKAELSFVDSDLSSVAFGSFADAANSTITATLDGRSSRFVQGSTLTLSRDVDGTWSCTIVGGALWAPELKPFYCA